jgi:AraC-like DNA-binding protein
MSGIELCNQLKDDEKTSHIPIILLTSFSADEYRIEGLTHGADAYVTKPFNIDVLDAQINNLLESRSKLRERFSHDFIFRQHTTTANEIDEKFLHRVIETIEMNISDNSFNAELLSKKIGMSRMQLYRKLRSLTDQTVHEFIRSIRLKKAVQLLAERRMTITQVAYEVGFNDLTYFARCFRKQYKKSPSEFIATES